MDAHLGLTLSQSDFSALKEIAKGHISEKIREILGSFDLDQAEALLKAEKTTMRTTFRMDLDLAKQLDDVAKKLEVQPAKLARAIVEHELRTKHQVLPKS